MGSATILLEIVADPIIHDPIIHHYSYTNWQFSIRKYLKFNLANLVNPLFIALV